MKYEIEIKEIVPRDGSDYPNRNTIYNQTVDKLNLIAIIKAVNSIDGIGDVQLGGIQGTPIIFTENGSNKTKDK